MMEKLNLKQAVVVEGRYDINALKRVCGSLIIETGGFRIFSDKEKLALLRRLALERGLIILTDSDPAGFVIRNHLRGALGDGDIRHAYIPELSGKERRKRAPSKLGLLGVEGMEDEIIIEALKRVGTQDDLPRNPEKITKAELYEAGLSGRDYSARRRAKLLAAAGLPSSMSANAMLEALNLFYTREEFQKLLNGLDLSDIT